MFFRYCLISRGSTRPLLVQAGVNVPLLRERLTEILEALPKVSGQTVNVSPSNELSRLFHRTDKLAQQHGDQFMASEWFVLAVVDDSGGWARRCVLLVRKKED